MGYIRLRWLLAAVPIPWVCSDEFYTIRRRYAGRVRKDELHPELNPTYPTISSWLEDDYVLVRRVGTDAYRSLRGCIVLLRDPSDRTRTLLRKLSAVEGDWVTKSEFFRMMVPIGHGYLQRGSEDEGEQLPLALIEGVATRVVWPPFRRQKLPAQVAQ